ncbi:MAG: aminoacyl-tRNA hydrolase [Patescibacteria group bacterium]|jgi:PTH1 family peptidyl-tRNA hydrolase
MKFIAGLGNPGKQYENTRHNIGFLVLDELIKKFPEAAFTENKKIAGQLAKTQEVVLFKPGKFMNLSGEPIRKAVDYYKILPKNIYLVRDDVDLPFGQIKIQFARGSAGHKGAISTIEYLNTDEFWHLRVGIAGEDRHQRPTDEYVISQFTKSEKAKLPDLIKRAVDALVVCLEKSPAIAAQEFNQKNCS